METLRAHKGRELEVPGENALEWETEKEINNYLYCVCHGSSIHELFQLEYAEVGTCVNESKVRHMEKILLRNQIREKKDKKQVGACRGSQEKHLRKND